MLIWGKWHNQGCTASLGKRKLDFSFYFLSQPGPLVQGATCMAALAEDYILSHVHVAWNY